MILKATMKIYTCSGDTTLDAGCLFSAIEP